MKQFIIPSISAIHSIAEEVLACIPKNSTVCLYGAMGAGKTTLIKALCTHLGVTDTVVSPTFALVNEYSTRGGETVYHFDFYRINKIEEVFDFGYEEYFYRSEGLCFIEWPELVEELLPIQGVVKLYLSVLTDGSRLVELK